MSYFGKKNEKNIESSSSDEEVALLTCQDISTSKYVNKGASQSSLYKNNYGVNMWIKMKTCVITNDEDLCKILKHNNIKQLNNSFEIIFKDVNKYTKQQINGTGIDLITLKTFMVPLLLQNNSSLSRLTGKNCIINFVNVKNDKGEVFSSFINNLSKNDQILITDGVILNNSLAFYSNNLTVAVRPENHSSVFLLQYKSPSLKKSSLTLIKNLSKVTGCGTYSLFGHITKIIKYIDEEFMLLRIQCFDKCSIKIRKYPQYVKEFKNISKEENIHGIKYSSSSDNIDILVKNPCQQFITLKLNQRIHLNNVKVNYSSDSKLYSLHVMGTLENLKADPIETSDVHSLIPPRRYFPIPNELKPASRLKTKQILCDVQMDSNDKFQILNEIKPELKPKPSLKNLPLSTKHSKNRDMIDLSCSSDDNVNLSPCQDFLTSNNICNVDNNSSKSTSETFPRKGIKNYTEDRDYNCSPSKIPKISNSRIDKQIQKCNNSTPIKKKASLKNEISSDSSTDGSHSPSFFKTTEIQPKTLNQQTQLKKLDLNSKNSTQCIGPCRLIHIENPDKIVCGYCVTCFAFFPKSLLIQLNMRNYGCPKCSNTVHLTFFFKMNFLYGRYDRQAIEVCCYNDNAKHVIKKLLKKNITLEDYSSNHDIRKLFIDTTKSFIDNKTKVNIIVTPKDNTFILLSIDTKYIVTNSID